MEFVSTHQALPFAVFKPSGYGRIKLYEKVGNKQELSASEQEEWNRVVNRYEVTCKKAFELDVPLLIDAEESWMQDAADNLVEEMMQKV